MKTGGQSITQIETKHVEIRRRKVDSFLNEKRIGFSQSIEPSIQSNIFETNSQKLQELIEQEQKGDVLQLNFDELFKNQELFQLHKDTIRLKKFLSGNKDQFYKIQPFLQFLVDQSFQLEYIQLKYDSAYILQIFLSNHHNVSFEEFKTMNIFNLARQLYNYPQREFCLIGVLIAGNLFADGNQCRNQFLDQNLIFKELFQKYFDDLQMVKRIAWLVSTYIRVQPSPDFELTKIFIKICSQCIIQSYDSDPILVQNCLWSLVYIYPLQHIGDQNIFMDQYQLKQICLVLNNQNLNHDQYGPCLKLIKQILQNNLFIDLFCNLEMITSIVRFIEYHHNTVYMLACHCLQLIFTDNEQIAQQVCQQTEIITFITREIFNQEVQAQKEIISVLFDMMQHLKKNDLIELIKKHQLIKLIVQLINYNQYETIPSLLELSQLFLYNTDIDLIKIEFYNQDFPQVLSELQQCENIQIVELSNLLLEQINPLE